MIQVENYYVYVYLLLISLFVPFYFVGPQLSSDVAKENCLSNGNTQPAVNYGAPSMPQ